ncbi:MAG: DUF2293 domain-containing protein [Thermoplasmata archaeon]|nr:DUF2293 domain-containing protein [Thermoplasmata archaeon]
MWHARAGEGYWNPERGDVSVPDGWVFVPAGDAFVTREVKKGPHWVLLKRRKGYTAKLGVFCPEENLDVAEKRREETATSRARQRAVGRTSRERAEERYRAEMERAILDFLAFRPQHAALAEEIAQGAVTQATPVGSGRVGRTRKLSLPERAELAARAYVRHRHTNYEARLEKIREGMGFDIDPDPDDPLYREVKAEAHRDVEAFLERHR